VYSRIGGKSWYKEIREGGSLSVLTVIFPGEPGLAGFIEAKDEVQTLLARLKRWYGRGWYTGGLIKS